MNLLKSTKNIDTTPSGELSRSAAGTAILYLDSVRRKGNQRNPESVSEAKNILC